jgi:1-acyl-sn-glycerol-3-phosphate acyltransferase
MSKPTKDNLLLSVFARIWALWGIVSFIATFLIIFIPSMITYAIPNPLGQHLFIKVSRVWMNVWLMLVGCPLTIKGEENVPKGGTYIFTCNHNTLLDVPVMCPYIPGANRTIAKKAFQEFQFLDGFTQKDRCL